MPLVARVEADPFKHTLVVSLEIFNAENFEHPSEHDTGRCIPDVLIDVVPVLEMIITIANYRFNSLI